jgi:hypothetical protein
MRPIVGLLRPRAPLAAVVLLTVAAGKPADAIHPAPPAPSMEDCYELNRANEVDVVAPARDAVMACLREPPLWEAAPNDVCGRGKIAPRVPWSQCAPLSRAWCEARDHKEAEYKVCLERARERAQRDENEAEAQRRVEGDRNLTASLARYGEQAALFSRTVELLKNPARFVRETLPRLAVKKFTSVMADTFGPNGEIRDGRTAMVEEYYALALPVVDVAQRVAIRDPFVRFIQDNALQELRRQTSGVFSALDAATHDMIALTSKIADRAATATSFRPVPQSASPQYAIADEKPAECRILTNMKTNRDLMRRDLQAYMELVKVCSR